MEKNTTNTHTTYNCTDGNCEVVIEAASAKEAAMEYVAGGDWGDSDCTFWVKVYVSADGEDEVIKIAVHPTCPPCRDGEHDWEDEGTWASGGGVKYRERCTQCGLVKNTNTWAQDLADGEQGLYSISYE